MPGAERIQFDATIDEMVDTRVRLARNSKTLRAARTSYVWFCGAVAGITCGGAQLFLAEERTAAVWAIALVSAVALCVAYRYAIGFYYDWLVRRRYRRLLGETLAGATSAHCEIELRPEGVWVEQSGIEMTFHWAGATRVEDTGDAIEMGFHSGLVLARNRAFPTPDARQRFLEMARTLSSAQPTGEKPGA